MRWLTLLLLSARSMLDRPADPLDNVRVGAVGACDPEAERAASSLVRCSSWVSILMLACRGGLLMLGLSSPFAGTLVGCEVGNEESRRGDPTWLGQASLMALRVLNMLVYRDGLEE